MDIVAVGVCAVAAGTAPEVQGQLAPIKAAKGNSAQVWNLIMPYASLDRVLDT